VIKPSIDVKGQAVYGKLKAGNYTDDTEQAIILIERCDKNCKRSFLVSSPFLPLYFWILNFGFNLSLSLTCGICKS
jgi:hypothetical protein